MLRATWLPILHVILNASFAHAQEYDVVVRGGTVYDGSGGAPIVADVAVRGDKIVAMGALANAKGRRELDAKGMAVAPGFINMLSWAPDSLLVDGRSQSDIRQGVTLEVFGEGESYGPYTESLKREMTKRQGDIHYDITWDTLGGFLEMLEKRGVSCNIASFVGASTIRECVIGFEDRAPTPLELDKMRKLVDAAMSEGALGVGSASSMRGVLCGDGRIGRFVRSRQQSPRNVHQPHSQRGGQVCGSSRRGNVDRCKGEDPRRDLSLESGWQVELG